MYLGNPSYYTHLIGIMQNKNLTMNDFIREMGFDKPVEFDTLQASTKLFAEYVTYRSKKHDTTGFYYNGTTLMIKDKQTAEIFISIYKLKYNYYNDNFPSIEISNIISNDVYYINRLDKRETKIPSKAYDIIMDKLREFIPKLLNHIYVTVGDEIKGGMDSDYAG